MGMSILAIIMIDYDVSGTLAWLIPHKLEDDKSYCNMRIHRPDNSCTDIHFFGALSADHLTLGQKVRIFAERFANGDICQTLTTENYAASGYVMSEREIRETIPTIPGQVSLKKLDYILQGVNP